MPSATAGGKLDLSKLTDEEAKHVWDVVQRDFDLRKKEEDRLGDLKTKVEKEDTKRDLLKDKSSLTESHCIHCLQPFKFLVNPKHQCLDCKLYTCKNCSLYNKKECGWVCDPCRMSRMLEIGTLEWFHKNIRARFKRFGSAKVMRSLFRRLSGEHDNQTDPDEDDTRSNPQVRNIYNVQEEDHVDASDDPVNRPIRKNKRLLLVHPLDFDQDKEYASLSRSCSLQDTGLEDDLYHEPIVKEEYRKSRTPRFSSKMHLPIGRTRSPEYSTQSDDDPEQRTHLTHPDTPDSLDISEEDEMLVYSPYQRHSYSLLERQHHSTPMMNDLTKRLSAIESLLSHLEQKINTTQDHLLSDMDLEEQKLRQKLGELTDNISDKGVSSDEDEAQTPFVSYSAHGAARVHAEPPPLTSPTHSLSKGVFEANTQKQTHSRAFTVRSLEESVKNRYNGSTTDSELSELEDKVAKAAANVQNTESEVSDIESRIAALNAAGMALAKSKKKAPAAPQRRKPVEDKPVSHAELFARNANYRGSLTQRNPTAKTKFKPASAKPVMMYHS